MKKWILTIGFLIFSLSTNAGEMQFQKQQKVVSFEEMDPNLLDQMKRGEKPDLVVLFSRGEEIPLRFFLDGECFTFKSSDDLNIFLEVLEPLFLRFDGQEFLFSQDLTLWKPAWEFFTGSFFLGLDEKKRLFFHCETNIR